MKKENQTERDRHCWNCRFFDAYYTKGFCRFDKVKRGYCRKHDKIIDKSESCEIWSFHYFAQSMRKSVIARILEDMAEHITEIKQILEEESEESNNTNNPKATKK